MAERDKELQLLEKRFAELADRAWQQNLFVFTGFLSLAEQEVLWRSAAKAGVHNRIIRRNGWCRAVYGQVRRSGGIRI